MEAKTAQEAHERSGEAAPEGAPRMAEIRAGLSPGEAMTVLVCGGREFNNKELLYAALNKIHDERGITRIVHGGARGADSIGALWALFKGVYSAGYPAQWGIHGKAAGAIRNQEMLDVEKVDLVVACPGGNGTADMVRRAKKAGVTVMEL